MRGRDDAVERLSPVCVPDLSQHRMKFRFQLGIDSRPAKTHVDEPVGHTEGDIELVAEEIAQGAALVVHRGNKEQVPESLAIFAVVDDPFDAALPGLQRGADTGSRFRVGLGSLQEAAVAADGLLGRCNPSRA